MIVYAMTDGFAHDLRYEEVGYVLEVREIKYADDSSELPSLEDLHDPVAMQTKKNAEAAEQLRLKNIEFDVGAAELLDRLCTLTVTQINTYIDNNVTDLASARTMFKRVVLVLALVARR